MTLQPQVMPSAQTMPDPEAIEATQALLPYLNSESKVEQSKAQYLAYRFTGFNVHEAILQADISYRTVMRWRKADAQFNKLDEAASGPGRLQMRREVLHTLFSRNYHLALELDYDVLMKSLGRLKDSQGQVVPMSSREVAYLNRMRSNYTPAQFEAISELLDPTKPKEFNFAQFIMNISQIHHHVGANNVKAIQTDQENQDGPEESLPQVSGP